MEGMKYIKLFENFQDIDSLCKKYAIGNYTIGSDGMVDVDGYVDLSFKRLKNIPIKFGIVSRGFGCPANGLTSLEGCPERIGGNFDCAANKLTSLEGCPKEVGGDFDCSRNHLSSLEGGPNEVGDDFKCQINNLTSLEGCIEKISGYFICEYNNLTSLEGCPKKVGGWFNCSHNKLTSLMWCPKEVGNDFAYYNNKLKIIDYLPERVEGDIYFNNNRIRDIKVEDINYKFFGKCHLDGNPIDSLFQYWEGDLKSFLLDLDLEDFIRDDGKSLDILRFEYALNGKEYNREDIKRNYKLIYKK